MTSTSTASPHVVILASILTIAAVAWPRLSIAAQTTELNPRPKIGLALSGGGARGAAHIGVLRVLEEHQVPIDYIAGTSMGAIVGGLYSAGRSPSDIERALGEVDWADVFDDNSARADRSFRRKRDDDLYLVKHKPGFNQGKFTFAMGIVEGQKIGLMLTRLLAGASAAGDFDQLPIPFRAVASDIATGNEVVLGNGNLADAIRASMSIPTVISPIEIDGQILVDGGVANNLPVNVVREMGADIVIAVDISTPLASKSQITSVLAVTNQLVRLLTRRNVDAQIATLTDADILMIPDLGDVATGDFGDYALAIPPGRQAAEAQLQRIRQLSLSGTDYRKYRAALASVDQSSPVIDSIQLVNNSSVSDDFIRSRLLYAASEEVVEGRPLDVSGLEARIARVYGVELFGAVQYDVVEQDGATALQLRVEDRSWGPSYVQFGAEYDSNTSGENLLNIAATYIKTAVNPSGGEWRSGLQIGSELGAFTEFHQPFGQDLMYFVNPSIVTRERVFSVVEDDKAVASLNISETLAELGVGRELGTWGEVRAGVRVASGKADVRIGDPDFFNLSFDRAETFVRFSLDEFDSLNFPSEGATATVEWTGSHTGLGADTAFDQLRLEAGAAMSRGSNTLLAIGRYSSTVSGRAPVQSLYSLGGFGRLPGFAADELRGQHATSMVLAAYRGLRRDTLLPLYAGVTLEHGNVWEARSDISFERGLFAGSLWIGADTLIGPAYIAYGHAEGGRSSWYFFLGQPF